MGTCITVIKLLGASSLGLLTSSLTYQARLQIPQLISRLNAQVSVASSQASVVLDDISVNNLIFKVLNVAVATLSTGLFVLAYKYSPATEKHPYLVYSALGAPLALASLFWKGNKADKGIDARNTNRLARLSKGSESAPPAQPAASSSSAAGKSDDETLGKSYIHISDDSETSLTSTPASSAPGSPRVAMEPSVSAIEQEVEDAFTKKEYVHDLESLQTAYTVASSVAAAGLAVCAVGLVGDRFFI